MTTYEIKAPDGKTYRIDGPAGATQEQVQAEVMRQNPHLGESAKQSGPPTDANPLVDAIRALPGGVTKGITAIAGFPGTVSDALSSGMDYLANKVTGANIHTAKSPLSGAALAQTVSQPFGGFYEPKTEAGRLAESVAEFAPSAVSPGGVATRLARVVAPAAASEGAGYATKDAPGVQPYAKALAALLAGGVVEGVNAIPTLTKNAASVATVPSVDALRSAATQAYQKAADAGVIIKPDAMRAMSNDLSDRLTAAGIDPTLHPGATAALKRIATTDGETSLAQMDVLRRVAGAAAGSHSADERRIGQIILNHIDDFVQGLKPADVISGDATAASQALADARQLWARQAKGAQLDALAEKAQSRAETVGGSGLENALRVQFRQLAMNDAKMRRFSPDEQDAIKAVAKGGPIANALRLVGKLAPTHAVTALPELGATALNPAAVAVPIAGMIGRIGATAATKRAAQLASALARNGAPLALEKQDVSKAALLSQLMASQANN